MVVKNTGGSSEPGLTVGTDIIPFPNAKQDGLSKVIRPWRTSNLVLHCPVSEEECRSRLTSLIAGPFWGQYNPAFKGRVMVVGEIRPTGVFLLRYRFPFTDWCTQVLKCRVVPYGDGSCVVGRMHAFSLVRWFLGFFVALTSLVTALLILNGVGAGVVALFMTVFVLGIMAASGYKADRQAGEFLASIKSTLVPPQAH